MINKKSDLLVNKFYDRWLGPFKVTKRCSDLVYKILNTDSEKTKQVHFNMLKAASLKNVRDDIGQNAPASYTNEESFEEEVSFNDKVPSLPSVANAVVPAGTQNAVTAKAAPPNKQVNDHLATDHMATQSQASDNSAVPNAPVQFLAEPPAAIPDISADNASFVAALPTVQPVAP